VKQKHEVGGIPAVRSTSPASALLAGPFREGMWRGKPGREVVDIARRRTTVRSWAGSGTKRETVAAPRWVRATNWAACVVGSGSVSSAPNTRADGGEELRNGPTRLAGTSMSSRPADGGGREATEAGTPISSARDGEEDANSQQRLPPPPPPLYYTETPAGAASGAHTATSRSASSSLSQYHPPLFCSVSRGRKKVSARPQCSTQEFVHIRK
jgi:hypothetical protein